MNENIKKFIEHQTCATICCVDELGAAYCFSCFYAFDHKEGLLYFKSLATSQHSGMIRKNPFIAGSILPNKLNPFIIKGIQFTGVVLDAREEFLEEAAAMYHKKYPIAHAVPGDMWIIQLYHIKMTDGAVGFGNKILWDRNSDVLQ